MERLGKRKGYSLVGCDSNGANAFFVKNDCLGDLKILSAQEAYRPNKHRIERGYSTEEQFKTIESLPFVEIK